MIVGVITLHGIPEGMYSEEYGQFFIDMLLKFMKDINLLKSLPLEFFSFAYNLLENCELKLLQVDVIKEIAMLYSKTICEYTDEPLTLLHEAMNLLRIFIIRLKKEIRIEEKTVDVLISIGFPFMFDLSFEHTLEQEKNKAQLDKVKQSTVSLIAKHLNNPQVLNIKKVNGKISNITIQTALKLLKVISEYDKSLMAKIIAPFKFLFEM